MARPSEQLKRQAEQMFAPDLSGAVAAAIDEEESRAAPLAAGPRFLDERFYDRLGAGRFSGRLTVIWDGADEFVFQPDPTGPFAYRTAAGAVIQPRLMYTDGGSIPRILRGLKNFSSWGYAPAFIIHDWLFTAKKCDFAPDNTHRFEETATLMAEGMKSLMENGFINFLGHGQKLPKSASTVYLMYLAVRSPAARKVWDDDATVTCLVPTG
jgi:hypothetical protein